MANGNSNLLLWGGVAVAAIVGVVLITRPAKAQPPPQVPGPGPQPPGPSGAATPMPPLPPPKAMMDAGMNSTLAATVQNQLLTSSDAQSLMDLATTLGSQGFANSASALNAKAFLLKQPDPSSILDAVQSAPVASAFIPASFTPDPSPGIGKRYILAVLGMQRLWADQTGTDFSPAVDLPGGTSVVATGRSDGGSVWEVVVMTSNGVQLGWINGTTLLPATS